MVWMVWLPIIGATLGILAYVSGNMVYADYLNIMYIPHSGELVVFGSAFIGATIGFLWYNSYPAQVFMGDTGSMFLGGCVCAFACSLGCPLILIFVGVIYWVEAFSVILQRTYFKLTHGKRIFKMSPIHHHFEMSGWSEVKIVAGFSIVTLIFCVIAFFAVQQMVADQNAALLEQYQAALGQ